MFTRSPSFEYVMSSAQINVVDIRLRLSGAVYVLPLHAFMALTETTSDKYY